MLTSVQAGRALAALAVTAFHLSLMMGESRYGGITVFREYTAYGNLGVDFFFVLSGFIIMHAHAQDIGQPQAAGRYLRRRFIRLFPVYWLYTATFTLLVWLGVGSAATLPREPVEWVASVSLLRFSPANPPLPVAWTLFHEVAFYLVFAVLIVHRTAGIALLAGWSALCLALFDYPGEGTATAWATYTSLSNLYFLLGMAAWRLMRLGPRWCQPGLVVGLLALAAAVLAWPAEPRGARLLLAVGFALVIGAMAGLEQARPLRLPAWLVRVGDASYTQYMLHLPLAGMLLKLMMASGGHRALGGPATYLVVLACTVALSVLVWRWVEVPLLDRMRPPRGARSAGMGTRPA